MHKNAKSEQKTPRAQGIKNNIATTITAILSHRYGIEITAKEAK